jgi:hypothetical protein
MNAKPGTVRMADPSRQGPVLVLVLAAVVLGFAVAACNPGPATPSGPTVTPLVTTGVRGQVLAGPTCPVQRAGQSPCVRPVSGATILALDSAGHEAGRTESDAAGAYFLRLPPGTYTIAAQAVSGLMRIPAPATVTVPDGTPVQLDLQYDTGIR